MEPRPARRRGSRSLRSPPSSLPAAALAAGAQSSQPARPPARPPPGARRAGLPLPGLAPPPPAQPFLRPRLHPAKGLTFSPRSSRVSPPSSGRAGTQEWVGGVGGRGHAEGGGCHTASSLAGSGLTGRTARKLRALARLPPGSPASPLGAGSPPSRLSLTPPSGSTQPLLHGLSITRP